MGEKLEIYFYRHGYTKSNEEGRFGGRINPVLSEAGYDEIRSLREEYVYEDVDHVFTSPAIRAQQTAALLFPEQDAQILEGLWEFHFGPGEYVKVTDFVGTEVYKKYLAKEMDCTFDPENGSSETMLEASFRVMAALTRIITISRIKKYHRIAVVSHGEILFLLMNACLISDEPSESFLLCPNGMGVHATVDVDEWFKNQKMDFVGFIPEGAPRLAPEDSPFYVIEE